MGLVKLLIQCPGKGIHLALNPHARRARQSEDGQTTIFVALILSTLMLVMALAVEGGGVLVSYRAMQSAADVAALTAAQDLPCTTSSTSCISTAEQDGCNLAQSNGFGGGWNGTNGCSAGTGTAAFALASTVTPTVSVPPTSCSPYNFIDYGNGTSCGSKSPSQYNFAEVTIQQALNIPIFNQTITLSAHAVARRNLASNEGYALMELDPNSTLTMGGNSTVQITGSVFANGGIQGNGTKSNICAGGWYTAGTIAVDSVTTDSTGTPTFSPPGCSGSSDASADATQGLPQATDPYAGTVAPPARTNSYPNCTPCSQYGIWYDLDRGTWHQESGNSSGDISSTSDDIELFPGYYSAFQLGNSQKAYFNPGVYTFTGGMDLNHGYICVYGSPSCSESHCSTDSFTPGSPAGDQWFYQCSPYGYWDSALASTAPTTPVDYYDALKTAPTFWNQSSSSSSSVPLNGVTFYLPTGSGGITTHGNGGTNGGVYPAAPNPCPGTGTYTSGSAVSFPAGATAADPTGNYTSTYGSLNDSLPHVTATYPQGPTTAQEQWMYPSMDWSVAAECSNAPNLTVWSGEMPTPQHLHFLFYITDTASLTLNGASGQQYTGVFYAPNASVSINGAGKGGGGPPWIDGRVIAKDASFSGNSYNDISYRGCAPGSLACGATYGSSLIQ